MALHPDADVSATVSQLLSDWAAQDPTARDRLVPIVYDELRRLAHHYMDGERAGHPLQTTALVHEVYLRLTGIKGLQWRDRTHFFAMAGTLMRRARWRSRRNAMSAASSSLPRTSISETPPRHFRHWKRHTSNARLECAGSGWIPG